MSKCYCNNCFPASSSSLLMRTQIRWYFWDKTKINFVCLIDCALYLAAHIFVWPSGHNFFIDILWNYKVAYFVFNNSHVCSSFSPTSLTPHILGLKPRYIHPTPWWNEAIFHKRETSHICSLKAFQILFRLSYSVFKDSMLSKGRHKAFCPTSKPPSYFVSVSRASNTLT